MLEVQCSAVQSLAEISELARTASIISQYSPMVERLLTSLLTQGARLLLVIGTLKLRFTDRLSRRSGTELHFSFTQYAEFFRRVR
jgi:hypothetical protein